ncbi:MAG: EthD family reductase [Pseudomonadota bacterium]
MIVLNALYKRPSDEAVFMEYYEATHMPLAMSTPGLIRAQAEKVSVVFKGEDYFMLARLYFPNQEVFDVAMKSPENRAVGKDLANFAQAGVELFVTATQ